MTSALRAPRAALCGAGHVPHACVVGGCSFRTGLARALRAHGRVNRARRYTLNIWDVGGQKTLRAYWRNYYEATDALVWVVDAADAARLPDCAAELRALLAEEKARA